MSEISKGDLVMIVRSQPCCGNAVVNGRIFTVTSIDCERSYCGQCGKNFMEPVALGSDWAIALLTRLKRIPPLAELESTETKEVLHA